MANAQREIDSQRLIFKYVALPLKNYTGLWWARGLRLPYIKWDQNFLVVKYLAGKVHLF